MADATDSKSVMGDHVWVQVPPSAPNKNKTNPFVPMGFVFCLFFILFHCRMRRNQIRLFIKRSNLIKDEIIEKILKNLFF